MKEKNKKDNLNQFDLDVYAGTIYGTSLPGKDKTKQETLHKKSVGGHRKKDAPSGDANLYDKVKFIVFTLVNRHIDITTPYEEWIKLGFALVHGLGEDGRGFFHQLSSMNAEYNYEECDKKYTSCMKGNGKGIRNIPAIRIVTRTSISTLPIYSLPFKAKVGLYQPDGLSPFQVLI